VLLSLALLIVVNGLTCSVTTDFSDAVRCDVQGSQVNPVPLGPLRGGQFSLFEINESPANLLTYTSNIQGGAPTNWDSAPGFQGSNVFPAVLVSQQISGYSDNNLFVPTKILAFPGTVSSPLVIKYSPPPGAGPDGPGSYTIVATISAGESALAGGACTASPAPAGSGFTYKMYFGTNILDVNNAQTGTVASSGAGGNVSPSVTFSASQFAYLMLTRSNPTTSCTGAFIELAVTQSGNSVGDPFFKGFHGQKFMFKGLPSMSYHIFSDIFISVNAQFASTFAPATPDGTVMKTLNISFENHHLTIIRDWLNGTSISVISDGKKITLAEGKTVSLGECYSLYNLAPRVFFKTSKHNVIIDYATQADDHINNTYFNINFDVPLEDATTLGGLLGQTAQANAKISTDELLFIVPMNGRAKTDKFEGISSC